MLLRLIASLSWQFCPEVYTVHCFKNPWDAEAHPLSLENTGSAARHRLHWLAAAPALTHLCQTPHAGAGHM